MKLFDWNKEKNIWLKQNRGISFEDILFYIDKKCLVDDIEHPNQDKYKGQRMMVMKINNYIYLVPYVESDTEIFLKSIIQGRKMNSLDKEEKELLDSFENNEWKSVENVKERKVKMESYARATIRKDKRVNIRISERDLNELQRIALSEGLPYQTLISSILHKYVNGASIVELFAKYPNLLH